MPRTLSRSGWFTLSLAVLLVGGGFLAVGQGQQEQLRDELTRVRIANDNLRLVAQARLDEVTDQDSLAFVAAEVSDVEAQAEHLRSVSEHAGERLEHLLALIHELDEIDHPYLLLRSISLALDTVQRDTQLPLHRALDAAETRQRWALGLTGVALLALLVVALRREEG